MTSLNPGHADQHDGNRGGTGNRPSPEEAYGLERKTPDEVREILGKLRVGLEEIYGIRLRGLYLFGSYARGDAVAGSDLDVLVVLDNYESSWQEIRRTSELTSSISLEYDVTVAKIFVREREWHEQDSPFLSNVRRDGVPA